MGGSVYVREMAEMFMHQRHSWTNLTDILLQSLANTMGLTNSLKRLNIPILRNQNMRIHRLFR